MKAGYCELHCPYSNLGVCGQTGGTLIPRRCPVSHPQGCSHRSPTAPRDPYPMSGQKRLSSSFHEGRSAEASCRGHKSFCRFRSMIVCPRNEVKLWCLTERVGLIKDSLFLLNQVSPLAPLLWEADKGIQAINITYSVHWDNYNFGGGCAMAVFFKSERAVSLGSCQ